MQAQGEHQIVVSALLGADEGVVGFHRIELLTDADAEVLVEGLGGSVEIVLGERKTAQVIRVDLPAFSLIGITQTPGRVAPPIRSPSLSGGSSPARG